MLSIATFPIPCVRVVLMAESTAVIVRSAENRPISEEVILAVAEATGTDPSRLGPLYDVVDPDALDQLFQTQSGLPRFGSRVDFTMDGCEVTVHAGGKVVVTPPEQPQRH